MLLHVVKYIPKQVEFTATFNYTFNLREERMGLTDYIRIVYHGCIKAWIILGDFNVVLCNDKRLGGNDVTYDKVVDF